MQLTMRDVREMFTVSEGMPGVRRVEARMAAPAVQIGKAAP